MAKQANRPLEDVEFEDCLWADGPAPTTLGDGLWEDGEETITRHVLASEVSRAVDALPGRTGVMIRQWSMGWSFDEIGVFCGLTAERAGQIVRGGIAELKVRFAE